VTHKPPELRVRLTWHFEGEVIFGRESSPHIAMTDCKSLSHHFPPEIVEQEHQTKPFRICVYVLNERWNASIVLKQMSVDPHFFRHNSRHFTHHNHPAGKSGCPLRLRDDRNWALLPLFLLPLSGSPTIPTAAAGPVLRKSTGALNLIPVCKPADSVLIPRPLLVCPGLPVDPAPLIRSM
jgi:hypothetical protein